MWSGFAVDQTTFDLTTLPGSPFFLGVTRVASELHGRILAWQRWQSSTIDVISIETGTGILLGKVPYPTTNAGDSLLVSPNGNFV